MAVSTQDAPMDAAAYQRGFDAAIAGMITEAARRSTGFRDRLQDAHLAPEAVTDVASLDRLPILTKDGLLELQHRHPPFGGMLATDAPVRRIFQSPGPLYEPEVEGGDAWRWAPALRAAGFGASDRVLVAFGFHLSPAGAMFEAACRELGAVVVPAGIGNKEAQVLACRDLGVTAFVGPPSYLKALFETADHEGVELHIDRAFVSAEPLPPSLRERLEERVPTLRQGYGTAEAGHLGYECRLRLGLHVPQDALVQICDLTTGEALHDDTEGQVVVTLLSTAYPLVRFGTGDLSRWSSDPCGCDAATPRTQGWLGRVGDAVKVKGMFLHPRQVEQVFAAIPDVADHRITIDRVDHKDALRCEVVAADDVEISVDQVRNAIRDRLRFQVDVQVVESLPDGEPRFADDRLWT